MAKHAEMTILHQDERFRIYSRPYIGRTKADGTPLPDYESPWVELVPTKDGGEPELTETDRVSIDRMVRKMASDLSPETKLASPSKIFAKGFNSQIPLDLAPERAAVGEGYGTFKRIAQKLARAGDADALSEHLAGNEDFANQLREETKRALAMLTGKRK